MRSAGISVKIVEINEYPNYFREQLTNAMFRETIRVDSETGVYMKWPTTAYDGGRVGRLLKIRISSP